MNNPKYRNFDLKIWRTDDTYCAQVLSLDNGEPSHNFALPFSQDKLEKLLARLGPKELIHSLQSQDWEAAKILGGALYTAVFAQDISNALSYAIKEAAQKGECLRIRLRLTIESELASLPWEFLYDERANRFLVLQSKTSIVRYLELPAPISTLAVKPPIRLLVMASSPRSYDILSVEDELQSLRTTLSNIPSGLIEIEHLPKATLRALQERLSRGTPCHIFHFIGHGDVDPHTGKSMLVMEDDNHNAHFVKGDRLGNFLQNHNSLRLVFLNACKGAAASPSDTFSGVAQSLIQFEIPAVISMQFKISDNISVTFARSFYEALGDGCLVDEAMLKARLAISAEDEGVEWGTPVLYLRTPDGRIFDTDLQEFEAKSLSHASPSASSEPELPAKKIVLLPEEPKGILSLQSSFYIQRPADQRALDLIGHLGITLSIQAAGQIGASSLLRRVVEAAKRINKQVVHINFEQVFNSEDFNSPEDFHRRFCGVLTDRLEKEDHVEQYWERYKSLSIADRCTKYMQYLLQSLEPQPLVLAMDEVDRLIDTDFRSSFFGMLRSWHSERATDERFERLDLVIVTSLEPNQLIDDPHQSPFNVSGEARLSDFSPFEIRKLSMLYGIKATSYQLEHLFGFIGGHPYLWQLSLHRVAKGIYSFDHLLSAASKQDRPYSRHLSGWYDFLQTKPQLREALKNILSRREYDEHAFLSLRRFGLVSREGNRVRLRCKLYEDYFREQLYV